VIRMQHNGYQKIVTNRYSDTPTKALRKAYLDTFSN
jgi:hypothetical protein